MSKLAPIVLFVYNRFWHTKQTVEAFQKNELASESELFMFSDGPKDEKSEPKVQEVRNYIKTISGFKKITIIEREKNWGLANNIIDGVTRIINEYGKIIVLEDDLVTSPYFLKFMNEALELYEKNSRIFVISGYSPPVELPKDYTNDLYLTYRSSSWGWGTWKDRWNTVVWENEFYRKYIKNKKVLRKFGKYGGMDRVSILINQIHGQVDSWAIKRSFIQFLQKKYTVYPKYSLVKNIGHDGSGVHCGYNQTFLNMKIDACFNPKLPHILQDDERIHRIIYKYHSPNFIRRCTHRIKKLLKIN